MDTLSGRAIALIGKRGTMRDNQLAEEFGCSERAVALALGPHCEPGERLVRCTVTLIGKGNVNEYRLSAAGPRKADDSHLRKRPTPPEAVLAAAEAATVRAPHRTVPPQHNTEGATMSVFERILKAYGKQGPMTSRELRKYVDVAWVSVACSQLAKQGSLVRLGGGAHSSIYGLPGQKLPNGETDAVATAPAKRKKAAKAAPKKRSAPAAHLRTRNAELRPGNADAGKEFSAFRTAIASDGAMIFLGAAAAPTRTMPFRRIALYRIGKTFKAADWVPPFVAIARVEAAVRRWPRTVQAMEA